MYIFRRAACMPKDEGARFGCPSHYAHETKQNDTFPSSRYAFSDSCQAVFNMCSDPQHRERLLYDNLLVRIHLIIEMILADRPCAMGV